MRIPGIAFALCSALAAGPTASLAAGLAAGSAALLFAPPLHAQAGPHAHPLVPIDVEVNYVYLRANAGPSECGCFGLNGFDAAVAWRLPKSFRVVAEYGLGHAGQVNGSAQGLTLSTVSGGARYVRTFHQARFNPFAQGLLGLAHGSGAYFPQGASGGSSSANSFAFSLGGGLDVRFNSRLSFRAIQADFVHSALRNNSSDSQNLLRVGAGVVVIFGPAH